MGKLCYINIHKVFIRGFCAPLYIVCIQEVLYYCIHIIFIKTGGVPLAYISRPKNCTALYSRIIHKGASAAARPDWARDGPLPHSGVKCGGQRAQEWLFANSYDTVRFHGREIRAIEPSVY